MLPQNELVWSASAGKLVPVTGNSTSFTVQNRY
jgi:hypothetical protein